MFRWIPEATREQKEQAKEELGRLPGLVPQVRAFHLGEDLGLVGDVNFDFALVADFEVDGFWTAVGATIIIWLVNAVLGMVTRPAVRGERWQSRSRDR